MIFRALDLETGGWVALRRFFPFGADGGGLNAEEQAAYNISVSRLADLSHPALRSVVCGGCDPVDGMPFIATEWIEGETLESTLSGGPLEAENVIQLVMQAIEVSELLSQTLGEEAVWVETDLQSIVIRRSEMGITFTFWISPLKWLRGDERSRGLHSVVDLTEIVMGWQGQIVNDQAGRGLGGWLNWLRTDLDGIRLMQARESLVALSSSETPNPGKALITVRATTRPLVKPVVPLKSSSTKAPLVAVAVVLMIVAAVGTFVWMRYGKGQALAEATVPSLQDQPTAAGKPKSKPKLAASKSKTEELSQQVADSDEITRKANEQLARLQETDQNHEETLRTQAAEAEKQGGVILWNQKELLLAQEGKVVTISGKPTQVDSSGSGKTIYLIFGSKEGGGYFRAGMMKGDTELEDAKKSLEPFLNKELKITGEIMKRTAGKNNFVPEMIFSTLTDIKITE